MQLLVDIETMGLGSARAYSEPRGDLSACASFERELDHLSFARSQRTEVVHGFVDGLPSVFLDHAMVQRRAQIFTTCEHLTYRPHQVSEVFGLKHVRGRAIAQRLR